MVGRRDILRFVVHVYFSVFQKDMSVDTSKFLFLFQTEKVFLFIYCVNLLIYSEGASYNIIWDNFVILIEIGQNWDMASFRRRIEINSATNRTRP